MKPQTEKRLTKAEQEEQERIVKGMKKNKRALTKRYGKDAEKVMYGRAANIAKKQAESMNTHPRLKEAVRKALTRENSSLQKEDYSAYAMLGGPRPYTYDEMVKKVVIPNIGENFESYIQFDSPEYNNKVRELIPPNYYKDWELLYQSDNYQGKAYISPNNSTIKGTILKNDGVYGVLFVNKALKEYIKPANEKDVDPKELKIGIKVEMEHTNDPKIAKKIALQHLAEDPEYYVKLKTLNLEGNLKENESIDLNKAYGVVEKGGSVGGPNSYYIPQVKGRLVKTFDDKEEAKKYALDRRKNLSKGERGYYKMGYGIVKLNPSIRQMLSKKDNLKEGVMSNIHIMFQESKDEEDFINKFFEEYGKRVKDTPENREWVKSMYQDMKKPTPIKEIKPGDEITLSTKWRRKSKLVGPEKGKVTKVNGDVEVNFDGEKRKFPKSRVKGNKIMDEIISKKKLKETQLDLFDNSIFDQYKKEGKVEELTHWKYDVGDGSGTKLPGYILKINGGEIYLNHDPETNTYNIMQVITHEHALDPQWQKKLKVDRWESWKVGRYNYRHGNGPGGDNWIGEDELLSLIKTIEESYSRALKQMSDYYKQRGFVSGVGNMD